MATYVLGHYNVGASANVRALHNKVTHRPTPYSNLYSLVIFLRIKNKDTMGASTEHRTRMFSLIESWQQSGLSQKAFCEQHPIAAHQFYYWHKIYRSQNDLSIAGVSQGFIELHTQAPSPEAAIEILFSCGHRLLFHQPVAASFIKAIIS